MTLFCFGATWNQADNPMLSFWPWLSSLSLFLRPRRKNVSDLQQSFESLIQSDIKAFHATDSDFAIRRRRLVLFDVIAGTALPHLPQIFPVQKCVDVSCIDDLSLHTKILIFDTARSTMKAFVSLLKTD